MSTEAPFIFTQVENEGFVQLQIHLRFQRCLRAHAINHFERAEKDRVLPRFAETLHHFVNAPKAFRFTDVIARQIATPHSDQRL